MIDAPKPPRLARALVERVLPADVREGVLGDLEEMFRRRQDSQGTVRARLWFWRQTVSFAAHFLSDRVRGLGRPLDMRIGMSWIDFKLAVRMLVRYPGLAIVSVLGMAVGMAIATGAFTIVYSLLDPSLPLDEDERVVSIVNWDIASNNREQRSIYDYAQWRELDSLEDVGAYLSVGRNLIARGAQPETVIVAEITASGFRVARVAPLLGRHFLPEDERPGAPDVVVIGHDAWVRRFAADPGIVGRQVQLGSARHTVIGVMPPGFEFPLNHQFWTAWRLDPSDYEPRSGPAINVFARLASGATLDAVQAELSAIAERLSNDSPKTHQHLRPRIKPYAHAYSDMDDPDARLVLHAIQTAIVLLLVIVCINVAILVYARTVTRQGEIAVRTALGASRRRIIAQLFAEALVLSSVAAAVGVGSIAFALRYLEGALYQLAGTLPFWMEFRLSLEAALYVAALAILAAAIVGIIPALKATGRRVQSGLHGLSAGSGSKMQMGRLWTLLIVAQVGGAVAVLPATLFHTWNSLRFRTGDRRFATQDVLSARLVLDRLTTSPVSEASQQEFRLRYADRQAELERRLEADPAVSDVTFSLANPGEELALVVEVEGVSGPGDPVDYNIIEGSRQGHLVRFNRVATDFFTTFKVPVLMGRAFQPGDATSAASPVLVSRTFVDRMFGAANPLGRRVRYVGRSREADQQDVELGRWSEIVGVVPDFPPHVVRTDATPRLYHPAGPGEINPAMLSVRVRATPPAAFADRLRQITPTVDLDFQLRDISTVEEALKREQGLMRLIGGVLAAVMLSVVVLSAAGIYALMSFTVARRRKEIGIRVALGADPMRILAGIFSRAFRQLAVGAAVGVLGSAALEGVLEGEMYQGHGAVILPVVAVFMTMVGLLAALGPARRGLRIQPTEALRED